MNWDASVDLLIAGSGGGGMVAALAAVESGIEPLVVEKQALVGGSTGMSGGMVWLPNNPLMRADGIRRLARGRLGLLRRRHRRRRPGLVARPPRDVPHRGQRDDRPPAAQGRSPGAMPRLERLLPEPQGRQRGGSLGRGNTVDAAALGDWARQGAAVDGEEPRIRGQDQRATGRAVLQPVTARIRRCHARSSCAPNRPSCAGAIC